MIYKCQSALASSLLSMLILECTLCRVYKTSCFIQKLHEKVPLIFDFPSIESILYQIQLIMGKFYVSLQLKSSKFVITYKLLNILVDRIQFHLFSELYVNRFFYFKFIWNKLLDIIKNTIGQILDRNSNGIVRFMLLSTLSFVF